MYEQPPGLRLQHELYDALKAAVDRYKSKNRGQVMVSAASTLDPDVRDVLTFFSQLAAVRSNGRPKGRAFLDSLRSQFKPDTFAKELSPLILAP